MEDLWITESITPEEVSGGANSRLTLVRHPPRNRKAPHVSCELLGDLSTESPVVVDLSSDREDHLWKTPVDNDNLHVGPAGIGHVWSAGTGQARPVG